jgi:hypothetical protein
MFTDESVSRVEVSITKRSITLHSDLGRELNVDCRTPDEFQQVLKLIRENSERVEVAYDF